MSRSVSDADLYLRGAETLVASWGEYARGATDAVVQRSPGVAVAVFPNEPERTVYNNALLDRDLAAGARADALDAMEDAYAAAGVTRFTAWVHESDSAMRSDLERRGYAVEEATRAMGMALEDIHATRRRERRDCDGVRSPRRFRDLQRDDAGARPAARTRHRTNCAPRTRRARARMYDGEPAVDGDGRARVPRRGIPRSGTVPRVRVVGAV